MVADMGWMATWQYYDHLPHDQQAAWDYGSSTAQIPSWCIVFEPAESCPTFLQESLTNRLHGLVIAIQQYARTMSTINRHWWNPIRLSIACQVVNRIGKVYHFLEPRSQCFKALLHGISCCSTVSERRLDCYLCSHYMIPLSSGRRLLMSFCLPWSDRVRQTNISKALSEVHKPITRKTLVMFRSRNRGVLACLRMAIWTWKTIAGDQLE